MKTGVLAAAFTIALTAVAQAQVTVQYDRRTKNSSLTVTWSSGGCGYYGGYYGGYGGYYGGGYSGYGGYYGGRYGGYGYGAYYPGLSWSEGPTYYSDGGYTYYSGPVYGSSGGYSAGYGGGYGGGYRGGYGGPSATADAAGPVSRSAPVADRIPEFVSGRLIEEGRRRLKAGDYRGAVDQFRGAVTEQTDSPLAQGWFAVALAIAGDGRNADKALRAAAAGGLTADRIVLADGFHDEKERARVAASLARVGAEGGLSAGFALDRMGESARLKQMAEKDPVARQLLPKN